MQNDALEQTKGRKNGPQRDDIYRQRNRQSKADRERLHRQFAMSSRKRDGEQDDWRDIMSLYRV